MYYIKLNMNEYIFKIYKIKYIKIEQENIYRVL